MGALSLPARSGRTCALAVPGPIRRRTLQPAQQAVPSWAPNQTAAIPRRPNTTAPIAAPPIPHVALMSPVTMASRSLPVDRQTTKYAWMMVSGKTAIRRMRRGVAPARRAQ